MARHPDDWNKMSRDDLLFLLRSAAAGSEDFEHAKAELDYRENEDKVKVRIIEVKPNFHGVSVDFHALWEVVKDWFKGKESG
jgi:hypothetical protein